MKKPKNKTYLKLIDDEPLSHDRKGSKDALGFSDYAEVLADALTLTAETMTVGVFGDWGSGKTSLMRLIQSSVDSTENCGTVTVWFNAWQYEGDEHIMISLCSTIVSTLASAKNTLSKKLEPVTTAIRSVIYGMSLKGKLKAPGLGEIEVGVSPKDMVERERQITNGIIENSLHYRAHETLQNAASEMVNSKIVVFIDDLDRCAPENVFDILQGIKLVFGQPGFAFVLGLDRTTTLRTIAQRFPSIDHSGPERYLDKLFQVAFYIPDYSHLVGGFAQTLITDTLGKEHLDDFKELISAVGALCRNNPRSIKRFVNNMLIDRGIAAKRPEVSSVPVTFFGFARALQMHWPALASAIRYNDEDICKVLQELASHEEDEAMNDLRDLASSRSNACREIYEIILSDRPLRDLLFSEAVVRWLSHPERNSPWTLLLERDIEFAQRLAEAGQVASSNQKARITDDGKTYPRIVRVGAQRELIKEVWPGLLDEIVLRADEDFWETIGCDSENGMMGRVLGTVRNNARDAILYLLEHEHESQKVYNFIAEEGVELLSE